MFSDATLTDNQAKDNMECPMVKEVVEKMWKVGACILATLTLTVSQRPCTDLSPLYLLDFAMPDRYELPLGVTTVFDERNGVHGYRFDSEVTSLRFPSAAIFKYCPFFPEEFSLLFTLRLTDLTTNSEQCLFSLVKNDRPLIGVRIYRKRIHFHYTDHVTRRRKVTEFEDSAIDDGEWHTMILTVTAESVSMRSDCRETESKALRRTFPWRLDTRNSSIFVANCDRGDRSVLKGYLREMLLQPGSDIANDACPSQITPFPELGRPVSPIHTISSHYYDGVCTWRDTGKLNYDVTQSSLRVCHTGVWQPVLVIPDISIPKREDRMDYIVWHQDIITAAPTIDIEIFRVPGEGLFLAAASFDSNNLKKQQSTIMKWTDGTFRVYQSLYTLGAQGWEFFTVGRKFFLAVANTGAKRDKPSKSVIYKWNKRRKRFHVYQEIVTWTARDIEYFQIDNHHYLAIANHVKGNNHSIASTIYRWSGRSERFEVVQELSTVGAYDWTHFKVDSYDFLVVANSYSGPPRATTKLQSELYFWREGQFLHFQSLETIGATDWEFFQIDNEFFLVVANAYNYGSHIHNSTQRYQTTSYIYKLNTIRKRFEVYQEIITFSAVDWEYFTVGSDHYLIVSNAQHEGRDERHLANTRSVIYRWQGVEKFVAVHFLDTLPSADWEVFTEGGAQYLVYANANDMISQVYRIKLV